MQLRSRGLLTPDLENNNSFEVNLYFTAALKKKKTSAETINYSSPCFSKQQPLNSQSEPVTFL